MNDARPKAPTPPTPPPTTAAQANAKAGATIKLYYFIPKHPRQKK